MSFPRYPKYKDSGVEWLGEVPEHWEVVRLGRLFRQVTEPGEDELQILSVSIHDGVSDSQLNEEEMDRKVTRSDDRTKYKKVAPGDLVYNMMRAWQGGFGTVGVHGMVSPAYVVARPMAGFSTSFIEQLLRTPQAIEQMRRHSQGVTDFRLRLYWEEFRSIVVVIPPSAEQEAVDAFVGHETAKIDALVAEQRRLIELLKEKRQAVISHAVTKGLNPHAPMKPSGMEWLGDVPEHWSVKKLGYVFAESPCYGVLVRDFDPDGVPMLQISDITDDLIDPSTLVKINRELSAQYARSIVRAGDLIISVVGQLGVTAIVDEGLAGVNLSRNVARVQFGNRMLPEFARWLFKARQFLHYIDLTCVGTAQRLLNMSSLTAFVTVCPPLNEQDEINSFLNDQTKTIDILTAEAVRGIELLQERRTALISAAVTGKIDVRSLAQSEAA